MITINTFIKTKSKLFWDIKDPKHLSNFVIVERVLNFGDYEDIKTLINIFGLKETARLFFHEADSKRSNYRPEIKNYFKLYFSKHIG